MKFLRVGGKLVRANPYDFNRIETATPVIRLLEYKEIRGTDATGILRVMTKRGQVVEIGPEVAAALFLQLAMVEPDLIRTRLFRKTWGKLQKGADGTCRNCGHP